MLNREEIKKDICDLKDFLNTNKLYIILSGFFILMAYGIKLVYYNISIDTEAIINDFDGQMQAWLSIGRFGLIVTKKIFGLEPFNPYVAVFLMLITMWLICILLAYVFKCFSFHNQKTSRTCWIGSYVFITMPLFVEQFCFTLQAFEVAFAIFLVILAAFLITKWILNKTNIAYLIIGILCMIWGFASYQAVTFLYISVVLACYIMLYKSWTEEKVDLEKNFFRISVIKFLGTFVIGYIGYVLLGKIIVYFLDATPYLDNMIHWGKVPVKQCVIEILDYMKECMWFVFFALILLGCGIRGVAKKCGDSVLFFLSIIALICSPFLLSIYLGHGLIARSQFSLQFVMAFSLYFLSQQFYKKWIKQLIFFIALLLSFYQAKVISGYLYTDYIKYEREVALADKITDRIGELDLEKPLETPIAFVGKLHLINEENEKSGETIGYSFFEWDNEVDYGSNYRIWGFMNSLGYSYKAPTQEQVNRAKAIAEDMKCWPNINSIKYEDGIVVVKLSE